MTYAIDFDGTLVEDKFPEIGEPIKDRVALVQLLRCKGHKIILWTCRTGESLQSVKTYFISNLTQSIKISPKFNRNGEETLVKSLLTFTWTINLLTGKMCSVKSCCLKQKDIPSFGGDSFYMELLNISSFFRMSSNS